VYLPTCSAEGRCRAVTVGKQVRFVFCCAVLRAQGPAQGSAMVGKLFVCLFVCWYVTFMAVVNNAAERQTVTNYILVHVVIVSKALFHSKPGNHGAISAN
jgi:hypothetical protein